MRLIRRNTLRNYFSTQISYFSRTIPKQSSTFSQEEEQKIKEQKIKEQKIKEEDIKEQNTKEHDIKDEKEHLKEKVSNMMKRAATKIDEEFVGSPDADQHVGTHPKDINQKIAESECNDSIGQAEGAVSK